MGKKAAYTGIIGNIFLTLSNFTVGGDGWECCPSC